MIVRFDFKAKTWVIVSKGNEVLWSHPELVLKDVKFLRKELQEGEEGAEEYTVAVGCGQYEEGHGYSGRAEGTLVEKVEEKPSSPLRRLMAKFFKEKEYSGFRCGVTLTNCMIGWMNEAKYLTLHKDGSAEVIEPQHVYNAKHQLIDQH